MKKVNYYRGWRIWKEAIEWALDILEHKDNDWVIHGLLDNLSSKPIANIPVIDTIDNYAPKEDDVFICAIGDPETKMKFCNSMLNKGAQFVNLIHPTAIIGESVSLGKGIIACPYSVISANAVIEDFVTINLHSTIGHDAIVKRGCTLSSHCDVTGHVVLGENCFMGSHALIIPSVTVENNVKIGAGSVVISRVKANATVFGIPAQPI
ncbi:NeuD/PglB/VioB family sugar acetyltransferase [Acetomicrobium sp.]|uniref:NeuD/PglB/VioB family sugar acetyltransferase n=1 Tax=Acetomicrobium sp. TaxID=1872099 RepID=UPI002872365B|nr:NeuD/PglB/VioB family sugar acetyltransferase [Acetomicrobium sp.]MDR9770467.1 NeuD/PglB/VioB family sugar acetyltransferase [Acetomicrobium sp.]